MTQSSVHSLPPSDQRDKVRSMRRDCLYVYKEKCVGTEEFAAALRAVGVKEDDVMFLHADLSVFGRLGPEADREELCRLVLEAINAAAPDGTIAMPTFTYSFCQGKPFDREHSPPEEMSFFSDFFRKQPNVVRSMHPIVSVAARGPKTIDLIDIDMDAYGKCSIFSNLRKLNGSIVFFGAPFDRATFIHHIEQMHGVPYRSPKTFSGTVRDVGGESTRSCTYQVLPLGTAAPYDLASFKEHLRVTGDLKEVMVGAGRISGVRAEAVFSAGNQMLDEDITSFLKKPLDPMVEKALVI